MPTVAVFQTDVAGFAHSYGLGLASRAAWAWLRHLHRRADRTLAPSTSAMESLAAHGIPRVYHWARGVDVIGLAPSARDQSLRLRWSPHGKPIVGFVGRLAPEKRVDRLAALARDGAVQVVVVGDGVDRAKLQSAMPTAVFTGALYGQELAAAYASMDVFVHTGEHETFCQAVQEALASGCRSSPPTPAAARPGHAVAHRAVAAGRRVRGAAGHRCCASDRSTTPLFARGAAQRAAPQLARYLRRAARPLRGGVTEPPGGGSVTSRA
ncbi:GDP-mannose-dependent alpha-mannosyltransferase [Mycobacterium xenopi 3993]|nr:GDP-mannose-dependent alpha-mannosyltransferase [Mycobacterium xenopi 3993]